MKCGRCRNEVARTYGAEQICSTCVAVQEAGEGQPMAPRLSRVEVDVGPGAVPRETDGVRPGSTLIDEAEQKKIARRPGRPARRRNDPRPKAPEAKAPKVAKKSRLPKVERFHEGAGEVRATFTDKPSQPNGDTELPEKEIVLHLNAAQWRILRKLLVRGLHGSCVEDVCTRLLDREFELAARKAG